MNLLTVNEAKTTLLNFFNEKFSKDIATYGPLYSKILAKNIRMTKTNIFLSLASDNSDPFLMSKEDWAKYGRIVADDSKIVNSYNAQTNSITALYSYNNTFPANLLSEKDDYIKQMELHYYGSQPQQKEVFAFLIREYGLNANNLTPKDLFLQIAQKIVDNSNLLPELNQYRNAYIALLAQTLSYRYDSNNAKLSSYTYFSDQVINLDKNFSGKAIASLNKEVYNTIIKINKRLREEIYNEQSRARQQSNSTGENLREFTESRNKGNRNTNVSEQSSVRAGEQRENAQIRSAISQEATERNGVSAVSQRAGSAKSVSDRRNTERGTTDFSESAGSERQEVSAETESVTEQNNGSISDTVGRAESTRSADFSSERRNGSDLGESRRGLRAESQSAIQSEDDRSQRTDQAGESANGSSRADSVTSSADTGSDLQRNDNNRGNSGREREPYQTDLFGTVEPNLSDRSEQNVGASENLSGSSNVGRNITEQDNGRSESVSDVGEQREEVAEHDSEQTSNANTDRGNDKLSTSSRRVEETSFVNEEVASTTVEAESDSVQSDSTSSDAEKEAVVTEYLESVMTEYNEYLVSDVNSDVEQKEIDSNQKNYQLASDPLYDERKNVTTNYATHTYFDGTPYFRLPYNDNEKRELAEKYGNEYDEALNEYKKFVSTTERLEKNIKAIELISELNSKLINGEKIELSDEEKNTLAGYTGWGGLKQEVYANKDKILNAGVSQSEFLDITMSTLDSFYTPTAVIDLIYKKLGEMGFKGGEILEPCCGVGKFIGRVPQEIADKSKVTAFEIDPISARIAYFLYPQSNVMKKSFVDTTAKNYYDVVVGNVPFGHLNIHDIKDREITGQAIHNYFINKSLNEARAGGVVALITSSYTMDSKSSKARETMIKKGEFLGAVRLPSGAFGQSNTEVVTDIIFLKKRERSLTDEEFYELDPHSLDMQFVNSKEVFDYHGEIKSLDDNTDKYNSLIPSDVLANIEKNKLIKEANKGKPKKEQQKLEPVKKDDLPKTTFMSSYFYNNQNQIAGDLYFESNKFGEVNVIPRFVLRPENVENVQTDSDYDVVTNVSGDIVRVLDQSMLEKIEASAQNVHGNYIDRDEVKDIIVENNISNMVDVSDDDLFKKAKPFTFYLNDEGIVKYKLTEFEQPQDVRYGNANYKPKPKDFETAKALVLMRNCYEDVVQACLYGTDEELQNQQNKLSALYDDFFAKHSKDGVKSYTYFELLSDAELNDVDNDDNDEVELDENGNEVKKQKKKAEGKRLSKKVTIDPISYYVDKYHLSSDPYMLSLVNLSKIREERKENGEIYPIHAGKNEALFTTRFITPKKEITHADNLHDALILSVANKAKVDFKYIASLVGQDFIDNLPVSDEGLERTPTDVEKIISALGDEIYLDPEKIKDVKLNGDFDPLNCYVTRDEYLSGNIYKKIEKCRDYNRIYQSDLFNKNIEDLEKIIPQKISYHDIDVELGTHWINTEVYEQFIESYFEGKNAHWRSHVIYDSTAGKYFISDKRRSYGRDLTETLGSSKCSVLEIFEGVLNQDVPTVKTKDPISGKTVNDVQETSLVLEKSKEMRQAFKEWIFNDETRAKALEDTYNRLYNAIVPREYDGSAFSFDGMNDNIKLFEHQKNGIARTLLGGNTLLAHEVGAGKTFEMCASAMEKRRLGIAKKNLIVTLKSVVSQFADDFLKLYPNAKLLVVKPEDLNETNRRNFLAKVMFNDYDAIIMSKEQFGSIPMSPQYQIDFVKNMIAEYETQLHSVHYDNEGNKYVARDIEQKLKNLYNKLKTLTDKLNESQDHGFYFEDLGIDSLYIDEAHYFKGVDHQSVIPAVRAQNRRSTRAMELLMKVDFLNEKYDYKAVTFATGTPLTNSLIDFYTMQRFLNNKNLHDADIQNVDDFMSTFGVISSNVELSGTGVDFIIKKRLNSFQNVPEAMLVFSQVADIKTNDDLKQYLKLPKAEFNIVEADCSPFQKKEIENIRVRVQDIYAGRVKDPKKDNMLKISDDGRKLGLDGRLLNEFSDDFAGSKLNKCVENVFNISQEDPLCSQLIFCDRGVPTEDKTFDLYNDIKAKLVSMGMKPEEIEFIHNVNTIDERNKLFEKVRNAEVKVLIGSTEKLGVGVSIQNHLKACHHLDIPWKPADIEQRNGRIIRQGNLNENVKIYNYVTKNSFDSFMYQTVTRKAEFIKQIMHFNKNIRRLDVDEESDTQALDYKQCMIASLGDSRVKDQLELQDRLSSLEILKKSYLKQVDRINVEVNTLPKTIETYKHTLECLKTDSALVEANRDILSLANVELAQKFVNNKHEAVELNPNDTAKIPFSFEFCDGKTYTDRKEFHKVLAEKIKSITVAQDSVYIGKFCGFKVEVSKEATHRSDGMLATDTYVHLEGNSGKIYSEKIGISSAHNLKTICKKILSIESDIPFTEKNIKAVTDNLKYNETWLKEHQTWDKEEEYNEVKSKLEALNTELDNVISNADSKMETVADVDVEDLTDSESLSDDDSQSVDIDNLDDPHGLLSDENLERTKDKDRITLAELGKITGIEVVTVSRESVEREYENALDKLYNTEQTSLFDEKLRDLIVKDSSNDLSDFNLSDPNNTVMAKFICKNDKTKSFYLVRSQVVDKELQLFGMIVNENNKKEVCPACESINWENSSKIDQTFANTWLRDEDYNYNSDKLGSVLGMSNDLSVKKQQEEQELNEEKSINK